MNITKCIGRSITEYENIVDLASSHFDMSGNKFNHYVKRLNTMVQVKKQKQVQ